jgi:hypothetical protein
VHGYGAQVSKRCTYGRAGRRTFRKPVALAVLVGHPSPAARLGPIQRMGRAACSEAHALSGHAMPMSEATGSYTTRANGTQANAPLASEWRVAARVQGARVQGALLASTT